MAKINACAVGTGATGTPSFAKVSSFTSANGTVTVNLPADITDTSQIKVMAFFCQDGSYAPRFQLDVFSYVNNDGSIVNLLAWDDFSVSTSMGLGSLDNTNKTFTFLFNSAIPFNCAIYYEA